MVDLEAAVSYVQKHGDLIEQARLASILWGKLPQEPVLRRLSEIQNPDGGFSYWVKGFSTVCDTVYILIWLDDLSLRIGPLVEGAASFLTLQQKEDGGWDEVERVKEVDHPSFLSPGKTNTRIWLTAYCAHWLLHFGHAGSINGKGSPAKFLMAYRESSGRIVGDSRATWDSLVVFSHYLGKDSEVSKQALKATQENFSPEKWEGSYLAWLICCLRDAGLPHQHPFVEQCLYELVRKQRSDGSWESEDGPEFGANATIEALRVLRHYRVI